MAILVAGTEASAYRSIGHLKSAGSVATFTRTTNATHISTNFSRHGMQPSGSLSQGKLIMQFPAQTDFWFHACISHQSVATTTLTPPIQFIDSATGQVVFQYDPDTGSGDYNDGATDWDWEYWDGAAFQELTRFGGNTAAHSFRPTSNVLHSIDVHFIVANDGLVNFYVDGVRRGGFSGDTLNTGFTQVDTLLIQNPGSLGSSTSLTVTEVIVATEDTRGMRLFTSYPTANGTNTAWTGTFSNADKDNPQLNDTDFIYSGTANQVETYAMADLSAVADNLVPKAVVTCVRAHVGPAGPQNLQHVIRSGTTDYPSSNVTYTNGTALADAVPIGPTMVVWTTDPDTAAAWTTSGVNAIEVGVKSIT